MSRIAYVNGRYVPHAYAQVHVEDRGYQFSDGVYEVCEVHDGHLVDETRHMARLGRSLKELRIREPMSAKALGHVLRETVRRNRVRNGLVYLQVTRGVAKRDHPFPKDDVPPAVVVTARAIDPKKSAKSAENGISVITVPENRWDRVDIKSVSLLPNVLARQAAEDAGASEAWFVDTDGYVTEGSATNAWIVDQDGRLITRPAEFGILRGITRTVVVDLAAREGVEIVERPFTVEEARKAREAFVTSATKLVMPVVKIDDAVIGNGKPGSIAGKLRELFYTQAEIAP
ncbi:D-amino-acid transaminase [Microbaculum marinisediminis]|uniref:Probable branched-chain-amino-acid aminotransferase n=1 Tax=Microbaculum marinisediminis TaxID=2931392 RepID=A0AAW5R650_9HYPH|nr:D-amino-acid transaminase [Microbaculum sp. A6E488]MCT8974161.1 D-amino-acid transaminase [Microbaculum sp. A6E488]